MGRVPGLLLGEFSELRSRRSFVFEVDPIIDSNYFTSQDFFRDPLVALERMRAAGPVVEVRLPIMGRVWMTTTQEMASRSSVISVPNLPRLRASPLAHSDS
jgi:hypothetical protein